MLALLEEGERRKIGGKGDGERGGRK